jgi:hypothetical protein
LLLFMCVYATGPWQRRVGDKRCCVAGFACVLKTTPPKSFSSTQLLRLVRIT